MKLVSFRVASFQSVLDSGQVHVGDITCLVGKNEAGKSALLKALYRLNPIRPEDRNYSVIDDYPRLEVTDYEHAVQNDEREPAVVVETLYELDDEEVAEVEKQFGPRFFRDRTLVLSKNYANSRGYLLNVREDEAIKFLARNLDDELQTEATAAKNANALADVLEPHASEPAVT